jgi:hypothetical protein
MIFVCSSSINLTQIKYRCLIKKFNQITYTYLSALLVRTDCWMLWNVGCFQDLGLCMLVQKVFEISMFLNVQHLGKVLVESHDSLTRMRNQ